MKLYLKNNLSSYAKISYSQGSGFRDTNHQVATVVMETVQMVLSQFKNFFNVVNWELNKVYLYQK